MGTRYETIVKYKTAYYSFYLAVALAMYMAGIKDTTSHENAKDILLVMGEFFQIQILHPLENYAIKDSVSSEKVKKLYHELNLKQVYKDFEEESYKNIVELISQRSANLPEGLFLEIAKKIYKRDKGAVLTQTRVSIIASPRDEGFE
ncbi:farnesyl pyrophosphate synthase-like [Stylophora pistillata]|uniref:farnesyl pyrophosphate synthase-like n=1 Tax=Stylophora pistillata TaxID=50429 RepID=UPI000C03965A|nr:farnesyl pyrophosphate synthase-like [Stylophora pistillata]